MAFSPQDKPAGRGRQDGLQEESLCEDTNWGEGEGGSDVLEGIHAP